jgi:hypothetical protein
MQTYAICLGCVMFHLNKTSCTKQAILSINGITKLPYKQEQNVRYREY